jgi:predicted helicase
MPLQAAIRMPRDGLAGLLSSLSIEPHRRGQEFEKLCRWYLLSDPVYRAQLSRVWLWKEWPGRWGNDEAGIDLVAETKEGKLWAIQAKAYDPKYSVKKADVDSFLSESARPEFSYRLLIASTNKLARHAERAMRAQEKPVGQLLLHDLERAEVAWPVSISDLRPAVPKPKEPRPHQQEAIDGIVAGCAEADRGQVIMA